MSFDKPIIRRSATAAETESTVGPLPEQLIMPATSEADHASPLETHIVLGVDNLTSLPKKGVLSIGTGPLLTMFLEHAELFGVKVVALVGVPDVEYSAQWEQAIWGLDRASYGDLVTEIASNDRIDQALGAQAGSRQKPDRKPAPTLERDRTRHFDGFVHHQSPNRGVATVDSSEEPEATDADD